MRLLSVIIPVFNEEDTIATILREVLAQPLLGWEKEVILVNDGSTDGTKRALEPFFPQIHYLEHPRSRGKGAAIRTALVAASGEYVVIQDADLEYRPKDIPALLSQIERTKAAAVYGTRKNDPHKRNSFYALGNWALTELVNVVFSAHLRDIGTGYKLFNAKTLKSLSLRGNGFDFDMEVTTLLLLNGRSIRDVPVSYEPRDFAHGKKIRARDGFAMLISFARCLLWRNTG
ncbi:MAG TPA: glycosyltransferase family 2 protein [Candidatus Paceibacterota bacterium]|nr:glycosyltransferase family 2 protein [Candidatus Paceibacterota bacterium]